MPFLLPAFPSLPGCTAFNRSSARPANGGSDFVDDTGGHLMEDADEASAGATSPEAEAFFFLCFFKPIFPFSTVSVS